jgi:peroxiredoxin
MGFEFDLLSDPEHRLGVAMGVEREPDEAGYGFPRRVTFLFDPAGVIRWSYRVPREEVSSQAGLALEEMRRLMEAP